MDGLDSNLAVPALVPQKSKLQARVPSRADPDPTLDRGISDLLLGLLYFRAA